MFGIPLRLSSKIVSGNVAVSIGLENDSFGNYVYLMLLLGEAYENGRSIDVGEVNMVSDC